MNKELTAEQERQADQAASAIIHIVLYFSVAFAVIGTFGLCAATIYWGGGVLEQIVLSFAGIPEPYRVLAGKSGYFIIAAYGIYREIEQFPKQRKLVADLFSAANSGQQGSTFCN